MNAQTNSEAAADGARNSVPSAPDVGKEAKRLAAVILEVLAGLRTPPQAAQVVEFVAAALLPVGDARACAACSRPCRPKPKGRQPNPSGGLDAFAAGKRAVTARSVAAASAGARDAAEHRLEPPPRRRRRHRGRRWRKRKPSVRALSLAARLRQEAEAVPSDNGLSLAVS